MTSAQENMEVVRIDEVQTGDLLDLEHDIIANAPCEFHDDPDERRECMEQRRRWFENEYAHVVGIRRETDDCIVLALEGVDQFGFPPSHLVKRVGHLE